MNKVIRFIARKLAPDRTEEEFEALFNNLQVRKKKLFLSLIVKRIFLIAFFFLLSPNLAVGQVDPSFGINFSPDVAMSVNPQYPGPNQNVAITLKSSQVAVNSVDIAWYLNGNLQKEGRGDSTFQFQTGAIGEKTEVKAVLNDPLYGTITTSTTINPGDVDILWEANTYTPPFYEGKALPTSRSQVKFVAIPHMGGVDDGSSLSYSWYQDFVLSSQNSGYGRQSALLTSNYLHNSDQIKVIAQDASGSTVSGMTNIKIGDPSVVFYPSDPLLGVLYNRAYTDTTKVGAVSPFKLVAEPYFFSFGGRQSTNANYAWTVNYKDISTPPEKGALYLKLPEGEGQSIISVKVTSSDNLLQSANQSLQLNY